LVCSGSVGGTTLVFAFPPGTRAACAAIAFTELEGI
jgi:hypothetical protein